jgi:hypothetical protein
VQFSCFDKKKKVKLPTSMSEELAELMGY